MTPDGSRDEAWFERLFRQHGNQVAAYARRRVPDEADDVVSDVFAAAWRHRSDVPDTALPWLYRTAAHLVLHAYRGRARRAALTLRVTRMAEPDRDPIDELGSVAARLDSARQVEQLFAALPPHDVEVLRLWAWEQLDAEEIGYVLSIRTGAARVRLHRARRRAEALLTDGGPYRVDPAPRTPAAVLDHTEEY